jgi:hypothetical protein
MLIVGGLHVIYAVSEFADHLWVLDKTNGLADTHLWAWGIADAVVAAFLLIAGASLLGGGKFGRVVGLVWISLSAVRWLYWIPAAPLLAVVVLVIDVMIISSLTGNPQFFGSGRR